jgi:hypothetical protein
VQRRQLAVASSGEWRVWPAPDFEATGYCFLSSKRWSMNVAMPCICVPAT